MKLCFVNCDFSSRSGPNSFATRLAHQLSLDGHVIADPDDYDAALVFIEPSHQLLPGKPIVQRLDGIWFRPDEFETKNRLIKYTYENVDAVVFQSEFNKKQITNWWGDPKKHAVIHNGIDLSQKATESDLDNYAGLAKLRQQYDTVFACSANWHGQKRLSENIGLFKHLQQFHPNSCLIVMGNNPTQIADKDVFYTGNVPHELCLLVFAISDWTIHLAWCDHAPNVICESLSQRTPVICASSGGTKELVRDNGIVVPEIIEYDFGLADYDNPPKLDFSMFNKLLVKPEMSVDYLDIKLVAQKYEELFESLIK